VALADYGTANAQVYIGSENFSCTSLNKNRECGIIVSESAILDRLNTTYAADWAKPSVTVTPDATPLTPCSGGAAAPSKTTKPAKTTPKPKPTKTTAGAKISKTKRR
jgi:phosphatidylserine/phosphatidylglycerophosphate/cardiolipin synthase-like enzyme